MPQSNARPVAVIVLLRARYRSEKGSPEAGFADVLAVMRLARHVAADGEVLSRVMAQAIENVAIRCVAGSFWAVNDPATLRAFVVGFDRLPKMPSTADVLAGQRDKWVSCYTSRKMDAGAETQPDLAGRPPADDPDKLPTTSLCKLGLQSAAGSVRAFTTAIEREFARAIEIAKLPLDKVEAAEKAESEDVATTSRDPFGDGPFEVRKTTAG